MTPASVLALHGPKNATLAPLEGEIPLDMAGYVFIIGAVPDAPNPLFAGNGHVWRLDCEGATAGGIPLVNRTLETWDYLVDVANPGSFTTVGYGRSSTEFGFRSPANTAFQVVGGTRLLVTCDAGRQWEVDPQTLDVITPIGAYAEWRWSAPHTVNPMVMSSAHPAYDPYAGQLYMAELVMVAEDLRTFEGLNKSDLYIKGWDLHGGFTSWRVRGVHIRMCAHQLALTEDYLIVVDTNFPVEFKQTIDPEYTAPHTDHCDVYVIRRSDLTRANVARGVHATHVELPVGCVHLTADWSNPGGVITVNLIATGASDGSEWLRGSDVTWHSGLPFRPELLGFMPAPTDISPLARVKVDGATGAVLDAHIVRDVDHFWGVSLYTRSEASREILGRPEHLYWTTLGYQPDALSRRMVELYADHPARWVPVEALPGSPVPGRIFRMALETMTLEDGFVLEDDRVITSPTFVPRRGATRQTDGYVVAVVLGPEGSEVWIFDAEDLAAGPLCRLAHGDLAMPFTIHTAWMATLGPRGSTYAVDPVRDAAMTEAVYPEKLMGIMKAWMPT